MMALNVPLSHGPDGQFPLPFQGEVFLLTRDRTEVSFRDAVYSAKRLKGRLFMTNLRMVFMIRAEDQQKARAVTFEMPFRGLWEEKFNQPIFGCNNLTAAIQYYDGQPFSGDLTMRIDFVEGGVNTFLPMFNNVLRTTRVQLAHENQQQQYSALVNVTDTAPDVEEFLPNRNMAFVDPHDPSHIYTTQPVVESADRRQQLPSWGVSSEGLRRR